LRQAEWREFDLDQGIWLIPASRAKMRREIRVPLPRQAVSTLRDLRSITGYGELVFPGYGRGGGKGRRLGQRPISENTLNGALRRLGYTAAQMTAHGFRAAASTLLNESGRFRPDVIEAALGHQEANSVRRAYQRGDFFAERVPMMQWWADYLDGLRDGAKIIVADFGGAA
jgi:integrase